MARWRPALHPRDRRGRFRPKLVNTDTYIGIRRGARVRVEHSREYRTRNNRTVILKVAR